ncbi:hypothetical protein ACWCQZ_32280 [Streptomyces sp. NPDC002285]
MQIDIPDGAEPIPYVWGDLVPEIGHAASAFSLAVYQYTTLASPFHLGTAGFWGGNAKVPS